VDPVLVAAEMAIKESSDELNPLVVTGQLVSEAKSARTAGDYFALAIATCGVGYIPVAPGTFGSLVGIGIYFLLQRLVLSNATSTNLFRLSSLFVAVELIAITVLTLAGIWAASRTEKLAGRKDPGKVVIDEVAGQLIALLPVVTGSGWITVGSAFLLFRFFDITKPYPARRLEYLESGLGIMADDLIAGAYAAVGVASIVVVLQFS